MRFINTGKIKFCVYAKQESEHCWTAHLENLEVDVKGSTHDEVVEEAMKLGHKVLQSYVACYGGVPLHIVREMTGNVGHEPGLPLSLLN